MFAVKGEKDLPKGFSAGALQGSGSFASLQAPGVLCKQENMSLSVIDAGRHTFSAGARLASTERRSSDELGLWPFLFLGRFVQSDHPHFLSTVGGV